MNSIKICTTAAPQSRIAMPTFDLAATRGAVARVRIDATTVKHAASFEGAPIGTSVWRPPTR
ncbi:hypothetical protein [Nocardioides sp. AE5]|uniref:hypothetical protein n=1 Tax=Nocardioides sp. AE5 TaxID=2962573 RepID=UPI002882A0C2|nr:hypothetical protein [Nocardioides sp. AE5]MDT0203943.1 hypothetical protein [Nocardioides sp. AE5]